MSGYNPEFDSDGDWDERGDLAWNEFDWQQYLKQHEQELARFLSLYRKMRHHPNRLDEIAHMMGWDREDWNAGEINRGSPEADEAEATMDADDDSLDADDMDPYTVHRHPVYVVTRSLYNTLRNSWSHLVKSGKVTLDQSLVLEFANSLHAAEFQAMMAINALDMGDFTLCVTHMKSALAGLNQSLGLLQRLPLRENRDSAMFHAETLPMLFDLRELWLRVMSECREEHRRGFRGE